MIQSTLESVHPALLLSPPVREVEMEVVFGTPSRNCSGTGICMIASRLPQGHDIPCLHAPAIIHCDPGHEIVFRFRKQRLTDRVVQEYFSSSCFFGGGSFFPAAKTDSYVGAAHEQHPARALFPGGILQRVALVFSAYHVSTLILSHSSYEK